MNYKKKLIVGALSVAALMVACVILAVVFGSQIGKSWQIVADDSDIVAIENAGGDEVYYSTSDGFVKKTGDDGFSVKLCDSRILNLARTEKGLIAVDEKQNMFLLNEEGELLNSLELPGLYICADYYNGEFFVALSSNYSDLYICRYDENFNQQKIGRLYLYNDESEEMELANVSVYGFFVREGNCYLFNDIGQIIIIPVDLQALTKDIDTWFSSGAEVLDMDGVKLKSVVADDVNKTFYLAGKDKNLYSLGFGAHKVSEKLHSFSRDVGLVVVGKKADKLFAFYELFDSVAEYDCSSGSETGVYSGDFNVQNAKYTDDGNGLFTLFKDGSDYVLKRYDAGAFAKANTFSVLKNVFIVTAIIAFLAQTVLWLLLKRFVRSGKTVSLKTIAAGVKKNKFIYIVLCPSVILLFMFCYYPAISSLIMAFFDYRSGYPVIFNGFDNFRVLLANPTINDAIKNMFVFLVSDVVLSLVPPIIFAWALSVMISKKFSSIARILLFIPGIIPGVAGFLIWKEGIYGQYGLLNTVLKTFFDREPIAFLGNTKYSMPSLVMMGFPFIGQYLIFYGALANIPSSYHEAAEIEGCSVIKRIIHIDLPFISAQMKYVFVMSFIGSVQNVARVMMTTQGAAGTQIPIYIMYNYLSDNNYGVSSAMALILFAVLMIATFINMRIQTADLDV